MHLSGAGVFGPPKDRGAALAVLREAVALGVNHIDTSDYYRPHVTNQLIREALRRQSVRLCRLVMGPLTACPALPSNTRM